MSESKVGISITLPKNVLERIDSDRGLIPRSAYLANLVEKSYKQGGKI